MTITRRLLTLMLATPLGAASAPEAEVKHLGDDNDGGLVQTRFALRTAHADAVRETEGVEHFVIVSRYEAVLYKGASFRWAEVKPAVLRALKEVSRG